MVKQITELTEAQIARIPEWVDKWVAIGLSTEPADFDRAEQAARKCYEIAGLPQPKIVLRCGSPEEATIRGAEETLKIVNGTTKVSRKKVMEFVKDNWSQYRGAQLWASWYSYITYFRDVCGWENDALEAFGHDEILALTCGWTWWGEHVCALSDRPRILKRDDRGRLHGEDGPALQYPDGWSIYCWHGIRIPSWIVESPEQLSYDKINSETNQEIKRCMIEKFGYGRYIKESKATKIHEDETGVLWQTADVTTVEVVNGTQEPDGTHKTYFLGVPPTVRTAKEAVAWTYGLTPTEYDALIIRT